MPVRRSHSAAILPDDHNLSLLHRTYVLYNSYRLLLPVLLVLLVLSSPAAPDVSPASRNEIFLFCAIYGALALGSIVRLPSLPKTPVIFAITLLDIVLLVLLQAIDNPQFSTLTNLLFIPVAIGNILIPGNSGIVLAAMASILLLLNDYLQHTAHQLHTGFTGALLFASALLIQSYNVRLQKSASRAKISHRRAIDLQKLSNFIIQHMHTAIIVLCEPDDVVIMNSAAVDILGSTHHKGSLASISPRLDEAYKRWQQNPHCRHNSFHATASTPKVQPSFTRLAYESDVFILIFLEDTTVMAQQAQQLKLASLGQLTASIAHEVRNPLSAISHSAQLMAESIDLSSADKKLLGIIQKHCQRINTIVETVLQLSRKESWHPEQLDLVQWVQHFVNEEYFLTFNNPEIIITSPRHKLTAFFDPQQLQQVLLNLCLNGLRYSERKTGAAILEIRISKTPSSIQPSLPASSQTWLEVIDRGCGIPEEHRNNVFNPFFTTDKEGTGLGLYICRELCEANQARLELLSPNVYGGCTFRITFASHP